jgi:hypothetical protein
MLASRRFRDAVGKPACLGIVVERAEGRKPVDGAVVFGPGKIERFRAYRPSAYAPGIPDSWQDRAKAKDARIVVPCACAP